MVWDAIETSLIGFNKILMAGASDAVYEKFKAFVANLIKDASAGIGWEKRGSDGHLDGLLRELLIRLQSKYSTGDVVKAEAGSRWEAFLKGDNSVLPDDIKVPVFQIVLKTGSTKEYEEMRKVYAKAETNMEKKNVYSAIGFVADAAKKKEVLEWSISGEVKTQDFFYPMMSVAGSTKESIPMTYQFFKDNFSKIKNMLKSASPSLMGSVISICCGGFATAEAANDIETFFKENPVNGCERKISQTLEAIRSNDAFLKLVLKTRLVEPAFWDDVTK